MSAGRVFTIRPGLSFADALVAGLRARFADDPLGLSRCLILLPARRAVRTLRDAFLRAGDGRAMLLPVMRPLGEVDEDELVLSASETGFPEALDLPPAISDLRRRLMLMRLVLRKEELADRALTPDLAARLAAELARLIDQAQIEGVSFDRLAKLVPAEYAEHWQETLQFLTIITEQWPKALAEAGCLDPMDRRNRLIAAQAAAWRAAPPAFPVIAAGSTGSIPATADLLATVAGLPDGAVVLPGLDRDLDADAWDALEDSHPQFGLRALLAHLGVARREVADWPAPGVTGTDPGRAAVLSQATRPAATTEAWRHARLPADALAGVRRLDCATPQEEAGAIALMMREQLETPEATAALVTPDRSLARRVAAALGRWGIEVDDSAGVPLGDTVPGRFLSLVADMVAEQLAPVPLLAALKHPLTATGRAPVDARLRVRQLERRVLRGPRPAPGIAGLTAALAADAEESGQARHQDLIDWLADLDRAVAPLNDLIQGDAVAFADLLDAHMAVAEALATTAEESGADRLWAGEAGEAAAAFVVDLRAAAVDLPKVAGWVYPALFAELMAGRTVRPAWGTHPRLFIWGPMEVRLQRADLMILGGLNEGTWPLSPPADPWMSRPMRADFGLPAPERRIGLSAHDFAQAFNGPQVILTRSERVEGAPTVPSRWLLRLDALGEAAGLTLETPPHRPWVTALDRPEAVIPATRPAPRPPVAARPRALPVTAIETWMRDPYGLYARRILGLRALDPLDAEADAAQRGSMIHDALDRFVRSGVRPGAPTARETLIACGREAFRPAESRPAQWAFWWPRFLRIVDWVLPLMAGRPEPAQLISEAEGAVILAGPQGDFRLYAKADRLERSRNGEVTVIDYKTGAAPGQNEVRAGLAPQLPLEAVIAEAGGFAGIAAGPPAELAFWRLTGLVPAGEVKALDDPRALAEAARDGLSRLIATFDDPATAYPALPDPVAAPRFNDYAHLARLAEWAGSGT